MIQEQDVEMLAVDTIWGMGYLRVMENYYKKKHSIVKWFVEIPEFWNSYALISTFKKNYFFASPKKSKKDQSWFKNYKTVNVSTTIPKIQKEIILMQKNPKARFLIFKLLFGWPFYPSILRFRKTDVLRRILGPSPDYRKHIPILKLYNYEKYGRTRPILDLEDLKYKTKFEKKLLNRFEKRLKK
ncbi:hypothetical protein CMESO_499 (nucleomorph) [Chroomonas mesostigmatica CCMP1168]|uniref:Uncharacterized protein n=1 Tax=Chroomonas mesostigmatica CCMP1168 TaxID=1195612 RepID=J7G8S1_9CRYP|nr:hypothetical protein CMESO_499 [Chroomonas mesostigmatica CCMP1168]